MIGGAAVNKEDADEIGAHVWKNKRRSSSFGEESDGAKESSEICSSKI